MHKLLTLILIVLLCFCKKEKPSETTTHSTKTYLHIAHTRTNTNPIMDSVTESINYKKYDMLWLGGDMAKSTSISEKAISHVDSIFDLSNPNTLWSLGNHDYKNLKRVEKYTKRTPYFSHYKNGITFIVLDTQDSLSNIIGKQKQLFNNVLDTLKQSSHLVVLHHKLIWMYGNPNLESKIKKVSNGKLGDCFYCINPNNFYSDIYTKLVEVKKKGIEVICIGGDIGFKSKEFEYLTPEGIHFLSSGIEFGDPNNKALLFEHDVIAKYLSWKFTPLSEL